MGVYGIVNDKGMAKEYRLHRELTNYSIEPRTGTAVSKERRAAQSRYSKQ
jgi:hypothetical protein